MTFTRHRTKDYAQGQFLSSISSGATSLVLEAGQGALFPSDYPYFLVLEKVTESIYGVKTVTQYEQVSVTNRSGDTFTIVRAQNGTTAQPFDIGDYVSLHIVSKVVEDIQQAIADLETDKLDRVGQLRLGNTAWRLSYFGASGNEVELAFDTAGKVLQTNGVSSEPTWVSPTVDINALTEDTAPDESNDFFVTYDASAGANKKVKPSNMKLVPRYFSLTAGENITAGDCLRVGIPGAGGNQQQITVDTTVNMVFDTTNQEVGQTFTTTADGKLTDITVKIAKIGSPTGTLSMYLYSDVGTTLIATSSTTYDVSTIGDTTYSFTFSKIIVAGTYAFKLKSSGSNSTSNYLWVRKNSAGGYASGVGYTINSGGTWTALTGQDIYFVATVGGTGELDTEVRKAKATESLFTTICGFANNTGTTGQNITIDMTYNNKKTGLTARSIYYLSDTAGAISTSAGTVSRKVGVAVSTTELLVNLFGA